MSGHRTGGRRRTQHTGNSFAFLTLMCGITSWVPLIIVITFPLTLLFFVIAHLVARRRGIPGRLNAAWTGLALGVLALVVQLGFTGLAALPGILGPDRREPAEVRESDAERSGRGDELPAIQVRGSSVAWG